MTWLLQSVEILNTMKCNIPILRRSGLQECGQCVSTTIIFAWCNPDILISFYQNYICGYDSVRGNFLYHHNLQSISWLL